MSRPADLGYNATIPVAPELLAAMLPWLAEKLGGASITHAYPCAVVHAVDRVRPPVASKRLREVNAEHLLPEQVEPKTACNAPVIPGSNCLTERKIAAPR